MERHDSHEVASGRRWAPAAVATLALSVAVGLVPALGGDTVSGAETPIEAPVEPDAGLLPIGFDGDVRLVVSATEGVELRRLRRSGWASPEPLPELFVARFDRSGQALAGLGILGEDRGAELWAVDDGGATALGGGVRSFAWHETDARRLAWTSGGSRPVLMAATLGEEPRLVSPIDGGVVRRYGAWGFAISLPGPTFRSTLLDASGVASTTVYGFPIGEVTPGVLGFTPGLAPAPPVVAPEATYLLSDEGVSRIEWLPDDEYVRSLESFDERVAAVSSSGSMRNRRRLLVWDGRRRAEYELHVTGPSAMAWDTGGRFVVVATFTDGGQALSFVDSERGEVTELDLGPVTVLALAVVSAE